MFVYGGVLKLVEKMESAEAGEIGLVVEPFQVTGVKNPRHQRSRRHS
jgi:hypothetical protein